MGKASSSVCQCREVPPCLGVEDYRVAVLLSFWYKDWDTIQREFDFLEERAPDSHRVKVLIGSTSTREKIVSNMGVYRYNWAVEKHIHDPIGNRGFTNSILVRDYHILRDCEPHEVIHFKGRPDVNYRQAFIRVREANLDVAVRRLGITNVYSVEEMDDLERIAYAVVNEPKRLE